MSSQRTGENRQEEYDRRFGGGTTRLANAEELLSVIDAILMILPEGKADVVTAEIGNLCPIPVASAAGRSLRGPHFGGAGVRAR
jgi:hypothetical protein